MNNYRTFGVSIVQKIKATFRMSACKRNAVAGFIGSVLLFISSFGIGWVTPISDFLGYLYWFREEGTGQTFCIIALVIGAMLLIRSWLRLSQVLAVKADDGAAQRRTIHTMYRIVGLWSMPLMFSLPILSRDMYAYIGQGRLMLEGLNPYQVGISSLSNYIMLGADQRWTEAPTPYTQIWLYIEQFATWFACLFPANNYIGTGIQVEAAIFIFRLAGFAGLALLAFYIPKIAGLCGVNQAKALWMAVANPLLLIVFIASGHNDSLMIGLAVAGIYYAMRRQGIRGTLLLGLSIGVKPITLLIVPFVGLMWAGKNASWPRKFLYWGYVAGMIFAVLALLGIISGTYFGWIEGMSVPGSSWTGFAPVGILGFVVGNVLATFGVEGGHVQKIVYDAFRVVAVVAAAWQVFVGKYGRLLQRLTLAFTAVVLLSNVIHPWYIAWLIPLFAALGVRDDWQAKTLYLVSTGLVIFSVSDQLDTRRNLNGTNLISPEFLIEGLSTIIAVMIAAYLIFFDRNTKKLFSGDGSRRRVQLGQL